jgi:hypothetical protein
MQQVSKFYGDILHFRLWIKYSRDHWIKYSRDHWIEYSRDPWIEYSRDPWIEYSRDHWIEYSRDHRAEVPANRAHTPAPTSLYCFGKRFCESIFASSFIHNGK